MYQQQRHPLVTPLDIGIRLTLFALVCVLGYIYLRNLWDERQAILRENAIVSDFNGALWERALSKIDAELMQGSGPHLKADRRQRLNHLAAQCCKHLGDDSEKALSNQLAWYRRAQSYDPAVISDPAILKLLKTRTESQK